ncbi:ribosome-associated translation inhibitor RaiA [Chitinispirillales bacterium ANBcel5]|uniref:ribosome hibernation-promoting factor, HPF/YfiA family n=1 Tax=Cellulosispirillum alkaliphilum TaxID=3039283 RepID=UPI002A4EA44C|nr:ribosome-associated translation inhibitor RaiA [Chitinispirillales bacterium ANBcel5]
MEIQITSRHSKASQALQDTITSEIAKLEKFSDKITSCHVILDSEHVDRTVEITMNSRGHQVVGAARAENIGKAIDSAIEKVTRQLKKINEKVKNHKVDKSLLVSKETDVEDI